MLSSFRGGCRANSCSYNGKIWDYDPICCTLAPFFEDEIIPLLPENLQNTFFQFLQPGTSLEGLEHYNDIIRGEGTFNKTIASIKETVRLGISSGVSLTVCKSNFRGRKRGFQCYFQRNLNCLRCRNIDKCNWIHSSAPAKHIDTK